jgi:hypothetical protein
MLWQKTPPELGGDKVAVSVRQMADVTTSAVSGAQRGDRSALMTYAFTARSSAATPITMTIITAAAAIGCGAKRSSPAALIGGLAMRKLSRLLLSLPRSRQEIWTAVKLATISRALARSDLPL